jgi:hypothetical protein
MRTIGPFFYNMQPVMFHCYPFEVHRDLPDYLIDHLSRHFLEHASAQRPRIITIPDNRLFYLVFAARDSAKVRRSSRICFRLLILALRCRPKRDLSPLCADIMSP